MLQQLRRDPAVRRFVTSMIASCMYPRSRGCSALQMLDRRGTEPDANSRWVLTKSPGGERPYSVS